MGQETDDFGDERMHLRPHHGADTDVRRGCTAYNVDKMNLGLQYWVEMSCLAEVCALRVLF